MSNPPLSPIPLPRPNPYDIHYLREAYQRCLDLESRHHQVQKCGTLSVLIAARLIGYLLLEAPTGAGREYLALEILQHDTDEALQMIVEIYTDLLLRFICSIKKCRTPPCSINGDFAFDCAEDVCSGVLEEAEHDHLQARENAFVRDRCRCSLCGYVDYIAVLQGRVTRTIDEEASPTTLAHIIPVSVNQGPFGRQDNDAMAVIALSQYGQLDAANEFGGENVHRLENVITMNLDCQKNFCELFVWLERNPEDPINHYRTSGLRGGLKEQIVLTTPDPQNLAVPGPRYIALHSAFARAATFSGAQRQIHLTICHIETAHDDDSKNDENSAALYYVLARRLDVEDDDEEC